MSREKFEVMAEIAPFPVKEVGVYVMAKMSDVSDYVRKWSGGKIQFIDAYTAGTWMHRIDVSLREGSFFECEQMEDSGKGLAIFWEPGEDYCNLQPYKEEYGIQVPVMITHEQMSHMSLDYTSCANADLKDNDPNTGHRIALAEYIQDALNYYHKHGEVLRWVDPTSTS